MKGDEIIQSQRAQLEEVYEVRQNFRVTGGGRPMASRLAA